MTGRDFLDTADPLARLRAESDFRSAVSRAYYGLYLECRDALWRWGFAVARRSSHRGVGQRLSVPVNADLTAISRTFGTPTGLRNRADYDLARDPAFLSPVVAIKQISEARTCVALLDALEADSARLAQAVGDIRKAYP